MRRWRKTVVMNGPTPFSPTSDSCGDYARPQVVPRVAPAVDTSDRTVMRRKRWMMGIKLAQIACCVGFLAIHHANKAHFEDNFTTFEICMGVATAGALLLVTTFLFLDYWDTFRPNHQELRYTVCGAFLLFCITLYIVRRELQLCDKEWKASAEFLSAAEEKRLSQELASDYFEVEDDEDGDDEVSRQNSLPGVVNIVGDGSCLPGSVAEKLANIFTCPVAERSVPILAIPKEDGQETFTCSSEMVNQPCQHDTQSGNSTRDDAGHCTFDSSLLRLIACAGLGCLAYCVDYLVARNFVKKITWWEWAADVAECVIPVGDKADGSDDEQWGTANSQASRRRERKKPAPARPTPTSPMSGSWSTL